MSTIPITPEAEKELDRLVKLQRESLINLADAIAKKANRKTISAEDMKKAVDVFEAFNFIGNIESLVTSKNPKITSAFFEAFMRRTTP